MKNVILLKYTPLPNETQEHWHERVIDTYHKLQENFPDDFVLAIPTQEDILFNCPLQQLYNLRDRLNEVIEAKEALVHTIMGKDKFNETLKEKGLNE